MNTKKEAPETRGLMSVTQAAGVLGVSRVAVYKKIHKGEIRSVRIGKGYAIPDQEIEAILGRTVSPERQKLIEKIVSRVVEEYHDVLIRLGD